MAAVKEAGNERSTMDWTLERVAQALGVETPAGMGLGARIAGASIDSRTVGRGELFFAIRGPRHDGHEFVRAALGAGAAAAVVENERKSRFGTDLQRSLIGVEDTQAALGLLGREVRRAWGAAGGGRLGAVTGSTGKTTTKEILAALVSARMAVLRSEGNLNNAYGLPLTLCRLEDRHGAAVVELGMSHGGELTELARIAEPEVGVVTNVAPVHLEFFASVDAIALAKRELIENLAGPDPVAVLNADDARVARFAEVQRGRVVTFGLGEGADYRAEAIEERGLEGVAFDLLWKYGRARLELPLVGKHNVMNALAALAAASVWGIGAAEARTVFPRLAPAAHRGLVVPFREGFTVLDDSYNSNPAALAALADWLGGVRGFDRRILAAGEMLELGPASRSLHREAGRWIAGRVEWILGVQGAAEEIVRGAIEAGHPRDQARFFAHAGEAAHFLDELIRPGDLVVLKGSRGVRMEQILDVLAAERERGDPEPAGRRKRR